MLSAEQAERFSRDGFLAGPVVLEADEVDELCEELDRVIAEQDRPDVAQPVRVANLGTEVSPVWQVVNIWQASPAYRRHIARPLVVEDIAQLTSARQPGTSPRGETIPCAAISRLEMANC